jgi:hypothetical protein
MTANARTIRIGWEVVTTERYELELAADELPLAALGEAVQFPEGEVESLAGFVTLHEGSQPGALISESLERRVTSITYPEDEGYIDIGDAEVDADQLAG